MIRPATLSDIPAILVMGRAMHAESPRYRARPWREDRVTALCEKVIPTGLCFVWGKRHIMGEDLFGMVAGYVVEDLWSGVPIVGDYVLYVAPTYRGTFAAGELVAALEDAGRAQGAVEAVLGISTEVHTEATAKLYERFGYTRSGVSLRKAL